MGTYIPVYKNCGKGNNSESDKMELLKTWNALQSHDGVELDAEEESGNGDDSEEYSEELLEEKTVQNQTIVENNSETEADLDIGTEDLDVKDEETEEENVSDLVWENTSAANLTLLVN